MTISDNFKEVYARSEHAKLSRRPVKSSLQNWSRWELQEYLERKGFAVYDWEDIEDLRLAVRLHHAEEVSDE